ncbi:MAG: TetR/AcrR family transcriptional regulator [Actinomycetota bacterium]
MSSVEALHRSPGRPRSVEADRAIGEAIVDLLIQRGYGEVTMEGVAARAGVAKTTIYRRWPTKALMVVESLCSAGKDCPIDAVCCDGSIRAALIAHLQGLSSSRVTKIITGLAVEMPHNPELADAVREGLLKPNRAAMTAILIHGIDSGELRPDIDLQLTADLLVSPIFFRLLVSGAPVGPELAAATVDSVLQGVVADPGSP